jgi:hypothetical protein
MMFDIIESELVSANVLAGKACWLSWNNAFISK